MQKIAKSLNDSYVFTISCLYRCLKTVIDQIDSKMHSCSFQQVLRQNLGWFLSQHWEVLFLRGFILKPTETA